MATDPSHQDDFSAMLGGMPPEQASATPTQKRDHFSYTQLAM